MKVICIDGVKFGEVGKLNSIPANQHDLIFEGEIYTVYRLVELAGRKCYTLVERPKNVHYLRERFAPLSDICETELAKQREELVTVNNEV